MSDVHDRLRRLLFLVPWVSRNPGHTVAEVAAALGVKQSTLLEELDLLTLVGRPPFQPDDFVDIYVEDDGRVYVDLDQRLSAPPRLTAAEGVALAAAAALLRSSRPGAEPDTLSTALTRLEQVLPPQALARYQDLTSRLDVRSTGGDVLADLSRAVSEHREVELEYFTASRGQTEHRRVQPWELFNHRGQWYLSGHCLTRGGERLFKLDRVAKLNVTDTRFTPPEAPSRRAGLETSPVNARATVRFSASRAPWVRERFAGQATTRPDGSVEVEVPADSLRWLTRWVLSFGGDAVVCAPAEAVNAVAEAARAVLAQPSEREPIVGS